MIQIHWYHKNLKCMGFTVCGRYFDFSFPFVEKWGWTWGNLVRLYWKSSDGKRNYLMLPSFSYRRR